MTWKNTAKLFSGIIWLSFLAFVAINIDIASENNHKSLKYERIQNSINAISEWPEPQKSKMMESLRTELAKLE